MSGESISQIAIDGVEVDSILWQYDCVGGARWHRRVQLLSRTRTLLLTAMMAVVTTVP